MAQMAPEEPARRKPAAGMVEHPCAACPVRDIAVCGVLDPSELQHLAEIMTPLEIGSEQTVFYEGDRADYLFNVTLGTVRLYKLLPDGRRQITGFLYPGDFLGLAVGDLYAYTAETVGDVHLCRFPRARLEALMQEIPRLEKRLLGMASNELIQAQDQMLLLGRKTAQEKIASFLLMLSKRAVKRGEAESPIELAMGRADIADFLGLTTETVSRTFTQLKTSGVIRLLENSRVALKDTAALQSFADGA
jgi:CRP/FNR family transcriptional regulator